MESGIATRIGKECDYRVAAVLLEVDAVGARRNAKRPVPWAAIVPTVPVGTDVVHEISAVRLYNGAGAKLAVEPYVPFAWGPSFENTALLGPVRLSRYYYFTGLKITSMWKSGGAG